ncbi:MAG: nitronate monooxygenase [Candidatus Obscuribacterales bacterium]|jgi:nitronate monooxygenase|nr:nitronate monooxygenase [Candidatus Obscuribacterales bacterium]
MKLPDLIQGGMGVGVSGWQLARAVSRAGQLGVVSGTMLDNVFARRLQLGDADGHMRRASAYFPDQKLAERVVRRYFIAGGKEPGEPFKNVPMFALVPAIDLVELTILANFVEVFLAREGHDGIVGINLLEKIQLPTLPSLYGAMLAGVDYVLMGAGIPKAIPGILDRLSDHENVSLRIDASPDENGDRLLLETSFRPFENLKSIKLKRPRFLAVVSSQALAMNLAKKSSGRVDGFVVENHTAGGHNAPPRGAMHLDKNGEPVYGPRDIADLKELSKLDLPFWLAGSFGSPQKFQEAKLAGAAGVQVGTPFAFCQESGIDSDFKKSVISNLLAGSNDVFTDPKASACGYPFKILQLPGSLSDLGIFQNRERVCDLGYLRTAYRTKDGKIGWRCPAEREDDYLKKGGEYSETDCRMCLCNGLLSTIGLGQVRQRQVEPPLLTAGKELQLIKVFVHQEKLSYSASEVVQYILGGNVCPAGCVADSAKSLN